MHFFLICLVESEAKAPFQDVGVAGLIAQPSHKPRLGVLARMFLLLRPKYSQPDKTWLLD